jgi:MYXO-CTERM domain-containing protein
VGEATSALTVEEAVTAGCSTAQIEALSRQIIGQGNCIEPDAYSELTPTANVNFGSAVLPYLQEPARDQLLAALEENPGLDMQINSMLRTVAQQYLLYQWFIDGTCGITLAAPPGDSNHETGLAIDIQQYDPWRSILESKDFAWLGAADPVHFDYDGPGAVDNRDLGVLAFQQLWNHNNPGDIIDEDGIYGPQTEARVEQAPAEGFPMGPTCGTPGDGELAIVASLADATDRFADGPSEGVVDLIEGNDYELTITVENTGVSAADDVALVVTAAEELTVSDDMVDLGSIGPGATATAAITVTAAAYSIDDEDVAVITVAAGEASTELEADIYSDRRWEWNGARQEGWTAVAEGSVAVADGALLVDAGSSAASPTIAVPVASAPALHVLGSADAAGTVVVYTDEGENVFNVDLSAGETTIALEGLTGTITSLRFDAGSDTSLDAVRFEDGGPPPHGDEADDGCSCHAAGAPRDSDAQVWLLLALGALAAVRSRSHR